MSKPHRIHRNPASARAAASALLLVLALGSAGAASLVPEPPLAPRSSRFT